MIKINVDMWHCHVEAGGTSKVVLSEVIMANINLVEVVAKSLNMSFDSAALLIMQQSTLAHNQYMQRDNNE